MEKTKLQFSRKLLAIPYALFLAIFVLAPLVIIIYYAFTNGDTGEFSLINFQNFFSGSGGQSFFESSRFKTIVQSFCISVASTALCLLIAYPVAYIIANCKLKNKTVCFSHVVEVQTATAKKLLAKALALGARVTFRAEECDLYVCLDDETGQRKQSVLNRGARIFSPEDFEKYTESLQ